MIGGLLDEGAALVPSGYLALIGSITLLSKVGGEYGAADRIVIGNLPKFRLPTKMKFGRVSFLKLSYKYRRQGQAD